MAGMKRKLKSRKGFTLVEMLVVSLILSLMATMVTNGIQTASTAYTTVVDNANAELLISTTLSLLQEELGGALEVATTNTGLIAFRSGVTGNWKELRNSETDGLLIAEYAGIPDFTQSPTPKETTPMLTETSTTGHLTMALDSVAYVDGVFTLKNLKVLRNGEDLTTLKSYQIRSVNLY